MLKLYLNWSPFFIALAIISPLFIIWDSIFTHYQVWGFNSDYLIGVDLYNLPLEEVLFFVCIPYACLYTYHCFSIFFKEKNFSSVENIISIGLLLTLIPVTLVSYDKLYTAITGSLLILLITYLKYIAKVKWLGLFYITYAVLLIPFSIVNGLLTGFSYPQPIVWYNNAENLGIRLVTIPVEDIFYGMLLILSITMFL